MAERPTTASIIGKIEDTEKILDNLINYYKSLEKFLDEVKAKPAKKYVEKVRKYLESIKKQLLPKFRNEMLKLHRKAIEERKMILERAKKLEKI